MATKLEQAVINAARKNVRICEKLRMRRQVPVGKEISEYTLQIVEDSELFVATQLTHLELHDAIEALDKGEP